MPATAGTPQLVSTIGVKKNGAPIADAAMQRLVESRVSQSIGIASRLELRFDDDDFALVDGSDFDIGSELEVSHFDTIGAPTVVFTGEITAIGIEQVGGTLHQMVVEAYDKSHRLAQISRVRTYLKSTYSDVVRKIAGEAGLRADVVAMPQQHDYLLQQGTDWAMLDEIARRTGTEWRVEANTLIVRELAAPAAKTVTLGEDLSKFRSRYSGGQHVKEVEVRGWDASRKQVLVGRAPATASSAPENSSSPAGVSDYRSKAGSLNAGKLVTAAVGVETQDEATTVAESIATRNARHELSARGELLGQPSLKAGDRIEVKGVGRRMGGIYALTTVDHIFGRGDLVTRFTAGGPANDGIVDLLGGQTPAHGGWASKGLVVGLVTNIDDPDGLNRVKVKFPALSEQDESNWARIASPMAGNAVGLVTMPSINDEVLVGFEQGDFRRPYVLGALWNSKDKPPFKPAKGKIVEYALKTVSGHVMSFGEEGGKEVIKLVHGKVADSKLVIEEKKVQLWVGGDNMVEIKAGGATIVLDKGDIKITGTNVSVKGNSSIKMEAPTIEIKASAQLKLEGAMTEVKGSGVVKVEAGGQLALKGAMTMIN